MGNATKGIDAVRGDFTHSGILPTNWTNPVGTYLSRIRGEEGVRVRYNTNNITIGLEANVGKAFRFRVTKYSDTAVNISAGDWTRNGIHLQWTSSDTGDVVLGNPPADDTYYIYVYLNKEDTDRDPALVPDRILADSDTSWPTDDATENVFRVLAKVVVVSNVITTVTQLYYGADPDDLGIVLDSDSNFAGTDPFHQTLQRNPTADPHNLESMIYGVTGTTDDNIHVVSYNNDPANRRVIWPTWDGDVGGYESGTQKSLQVAAGTQLAQLWNFDNLTDALPEANDRVLFRDHSGGPELLQAGAENIADWCEEYINIDLDQIDNLAEFEHNQLNWGQTDDQRSNAKDNQDHDYRYWRLGQTYTECFGQSIGRESVQPVGAAPVMVIDLTNRQLVDSDWDVTSATDITAGNTATGAFQVAGGITAVKGFQCDKFYLHDDITNTWDHSTLVGDVTGLVDIEAGTTLDIAAGTVLDVEAGTDLTMSGVDNVTITASSADMTLAAGVDVLVQPTANLDLDPGGNLLINSVAGDTLADVTDIFAKGLFVNTAGWSVVPVRLIPSGGGTPFNINVIGRLI